MVIDHIGIVVPSLEKALPQWEALFGYRRNSDIVLNTRQKVRVVFLSRQDSLTVKLIEPSSPDSPVFQAARKGGGLHHLCFRCSGLPAELARLQSQGARLIVPPQPGEAFRNHPIAFLLAGNNLNIELIDTLEKQGWGAAGPEASGGDVRPADRNLNPPDFASSGIGFRAVVGQPIP
ncbi:MAG TPA: VOC family protein [Candidatus Paceibacterota bacterium]|nr:VOC family protein [Verrucomicrobiota bacterium]HSA08817.1 VOC family protein [Candidatus Paceibacterota bacterium]